MPVVDLGMEPRQDFRYYKIDLEAAEIVSVNYKTGQASVSVMDRGSQFTKTFESPHPNFSKIAERLTHHVFNLMRFEESAREDVEWRGIKWQNRDSDGESITLSDTYKGIDGTVASSSVPKMVLDTTSYNRVGDLRELLAGLETEAKEAWGGKSAQMSLDFTAGQMRAQIERPERKEAEADGFESNGDDLPDLNINVDGGAIPPVDDNKIITDESDASFGEGQDQGATEGQASTKTKPARKAKTTEPVAKGAMKVVKDEAAA